MSGDFTVTRSGFRVGCIAAAFALALGAAVHSCNHEKISGGGVTGPSPASTVVVAAALRPKL